jgi:phospholipase C
MHSLPLTASDVRGPVGLGFRVPCLVLSPYSRGGFIASEVFDHTSQLKFLEKRFGVDVPNISKWRRETVGDMVSTFSFGRAPHPEVPKLPSVDTKDVEILTSECVVTVNGVLGVEDLGQSTPVPTTVPKPKQAKGHPRRPIHR